MPIKNIIFDLDGTLWDSREEIITAWKGIFPDITIDSEKLKELMGQTSEDFIKYLFPNIDAQKAKKHMTRCEQAEVKYLKKHGAQLYNKTIETLNQLSNNYNLFIVSNCQSGYIEAFLSFYKIENLFKDIECSGNTNKSKAQNINLVMNRNNLLNTETCYIGDKHNDYDAAKSNKLTFIWSKYGFGTNIKTDLVINNLEEIINILEKIK